MALSRSGSAVRRRIPQLDVDLSLLLPPVRPCVISFALSVLCRDVVAEVDKPALKQTDHTAQCEQLTLIVTQLQAAGLRCLARVV